MNVLGHVEQLILKICYLLHKDVNNYEVDFVSLRIKYNTDVI